MNEKIAENLGLLLRNKAPDTRRQYLFYIGEFLRFAGTEGPYDEWAIRKFVENLEKKGYSQAYISVAFWAIRVLLKARGESVKITLGDLLPKEEKRRQPTMDKANVERLINTVKTRGNEISKVLLALSSTYGLRQSELGAVCQEDINLLERTILIRTKKGGRVRSHYIPDEILPIVSSFSFFPSSNGGLSASELNLTFKQICQLAGVKRQKREVWHSIRRRLLVELVNARLPDEVVYSFMRWKRREMPMISVYYNPKDEEVDTQVFKIHPFLGTWR